MERATARAAATQAEANGRRRCAPRPRPSEPGALRPTDVVGAFFVCGIAFLAAAAVVGALQAVAPWSSGRWLALHLAFVGGISQLVLGAAQFFAGAFLAVDPPPRRLVRGQLASWNAGAVLLAVAVSADLAAATWIATALLLAGLGLWTAALASMLRASLRRGIWAPRWYLACGACFAPGIVLGALLARGIGWDGGDLLAAHMALNLAGWFGAAIVGTMHTFFPSLTGSVLRFPRLEPVAFGLWLGGVAALALGYALGIDPLAQAGWLALCGGAVALLVNVVACLRAAAQPLSLAARVVGAGQPFLLAGLLVATITALGDGPGAALAGGARATVGVLVVAGWIGLTVAGSLLHLLAVVVRVRGGFAVQMPAARPRVDGALAALATAGIAITALAQSGGLGGWQAPGAVLLVAAYLLLGARVAALAARVVTVARPRV